MTAFWRRYRTEHQKQHHRSVSSIIRLDARLIPTAAALWVFTAVCLLNGTFFTLKIAATVLILALGFAVAWLSAPHRPQHHRRQKLAVWCRDAAVAYAPQIIAHLCLISLILITQAVLLTARGIDSDRSTLREVEGASVRVSGTVAEVRPVDSRTTLVLIKAHIAQLGEQQTDLNETVRAYQGSSQRSRSPHTGSENSTEQRGILTAGSVVTVIGTIENRGATAYLKEAYIYNSGRVEPPTKTTQLRNSLHKHATAAVGAEPAALILGMAYGDDSSMPKTTRETYKLSGLSHLTAVSGANIAIMFLLGYRVGLWVRLPRRALVFVGISAVAIYTMLLGFEGSVVRSLTMGAIGVVALIRGTGRNTLNALTTATILCLGVFPPLALDMGFALSAVATASLVLLAPSLTRLLSSVLPRTFAELTAAAASASLWCTPLVLSMSSSVPLYSVPANLLAAPLTPFIMFAGLVAFGAWALTFQPLTDACLMVGALPARLLESIGVFFAQAPANPWQIQSSSWSITAAALAVGLLSALCWVGDAFQYRRSHHGQWARQPGMMGKNPAIYYRG